MTSFGWKRKTGQVVEKPFHMQTVFNDQDVDSYSELSSKPLKRLKSSCTILEDKNNHLKEKGAELAEKGLFAEAIAIWNQALQLTPSDARILEMKAQVLLQLNNYTPALQSSRKAVMCEPLWWVAHQTLGRAQLAVGDIRMAILSFSRAIHINPENRELWEEDLNWATRLHQEQKKCLSNTVQAEQELQ